jgi:hypothetical protein
MTDGFGFGVSTKAMPGGGDDLRAVATPLGNSLASTNRDGVGSPDRIKDVGIVHVEHIDVVQLCN